MPENDQLSGTNPSDLREANPNIQRLAVAYDFPLDAEFDSALVSNDGRACVLTTLAKFSSFQPLSKLKRACASAKGPWVVQRSKHEALAPRLALSVLPYGNCFFSLTIDYFVRANLHSCNIKILDWNGAVYPHFSLLYPNDSLLRWTLITAAVSPFGHSACIVAQTDSEDGAVVWLYVICASAVGPVVRRKEIETGQYIRAGVAVCDDKGRAAVALRTKTQSWVLWTRDKGVSWRPFDEQRSAGEDAEPRWLTIAGDLVYVGVWATQRLSVLDMANGQYCNIPVFLPDGALILSGSATRNLSGQILLCLNLLLEDGQREGVLFVDCAARLKWANVTAMAVSFHGTAIIAKNGKMVSYQLLPACL